MVFCQRKRVHFSSLFSVRESNYYINSLSEWVSWKFIVPLSTRDKYLGLRGTNDGGGAFNRRCHLSITAIYHVGAALIMATVEDRHSNQLDSQYEKEIHISLQLQLLFFLLIY